MLNETYIFLDRFILMLTDGKPLDNNVEDIYDTIQQGNAALNNSVIIFTYGLGPGTLLLPYYLILCHNMSVALAFLAVALRSYYKIYR